MAVNDEAPRCTMSRTREYRPAVALWYWAERTADYVCQQHLDQLFDQADREEWEPHCVQWLDGTRTLVAA